jgi:hypothetical protein
MKKLKKTFSTKQMMLSRICDFIDGDGEAGSLKVYDDEDTLLMTFELDYPCATTITNRKIELDGCPIEGVYVAAGDVAYATITDHSGDVILEDLEITEFQDTGYDVSGLIISQLDINDEDTISLIDGKIDFVS